MGFTAGVKAFPNIVEDIANELIASSSDWEDGDTTWTTTTKTADNARRCLKYTGDAAPIWIALEVYNTPRYTRSNVATLYSKGIRVTFSASWNESLHTYPSDALTTSSSYLPIEGRSGSNPVADLATLMMTYTLWTDATGFVLVLVPEPNATDDLQQSIILVIEHMGTKEYSDGMPNFYAYMTTNAGWICDHPSYTATATYRSIRPFAYRVQPEGQGVMFWRDLQTNRYGFKSAGGGKVYYVKPFVSNAADNLSPIYQSNLFWRFSEFTGIVDGDVVALQSSTSKYLCRSLASPNSTGRLEFAMKYVA